jgi:DNA-binding transcriptional LysR family regulator
VHVTFRQLKVFEAVARRGSVTRAAEELHLTQPTVSVQIRQLSGAVGLPLFEQIGKQLHLTDAGRELQGVCRQLFDLWSGFEMTVDAMKGIQRGRLRLAVVTTAKYFVPRLLGPFCARYPEVEVALEVANRDAVLARLAANLDDLYIMGMPPQHYDIEAVPFLDNPLVVIAPRQHELASRRRIPLKRLLQERFVVREAGSGTRLAVEQFLAKRKLKLQVKMEIASNEAVRQAVASGLGLSVISLHAVGPQDGVAVLDVEGFPLKKVWHALYPRGRRLSPVAATFFAYMRSGSLDESEVRRNV